MTSPLSPAAASDRYLALALRYAELSAHLAPDAVHEPLAQEMEDLWMGFDDSTRAALEAACQVLKAPAPSRVLPEFTTPDPDLNRVLDAALMMTKGAGMDVGLFFLSALEDLLAKLPEALPGQEPERPLAWAEVDTSTRGCVNLVLSKADLVRAPGTQVLALYARHPRLRPCAPPTPTPLVGRALARCPFCGHQPENTSDAFDDSLHRATRDGSVWTFGCNEAEGGCGASVLGDSAEDCLNRWNQRAQSMRAS